MHPLIAAAVFAIIFPAELPDKTALASLILGTRYPARFVVTGMALAFACHVLLAVAAGSLLHLLPRQALRVTVGAVFVVGAVLLLRGRHGDEQAHDDRRDPELSPLRVTTTSFLVILVAEFGDLTQIVTADLAARYHDPVSVGVGAVLALWAVGGLAVLGGQRLLARVPLGLVTKVAAGVMLVLAGFSLAEAF